MYLNHKAWHDKSLVYADRGTNRLSAEQRKKATAAGDGIGKKAGQRKNLHRQKKAQQQGTGAWGVQSPSYGDSALRKIEPATSGKRQDDVHSLGAGT